MEPNEVTVQVKQPDGSLAPVTPDAVHDRVRADHRPDPGPALFGWTDTHRVRDVRRQRREHAACSTTSSRPTARSRPRSCSKILQEVPGDPVGEHDRRGLEGQGALRRHRLDPRTSTNDEGGRLLVGRSAQVTFAGRSGCRSLDGSRSECALTTDPGRRAGDGPDGRLEACRSCSATTTSPTATTPTGSPTPSSRSRASRGSSATSAPSARCATRLGLMMIQQRLAGTDG